MEQPLVRRAALGFRVHSGWAVLVALADPLEAPTILYRRRIEIADAGMAGSRQPYHAVQHLDSRKAEKLIGACVDASVRLSKKAVAAAVHDAMRKGVRISMSGVLTASGTPLPALHKILSSHPLLHTAEGELFRNAIMAACKSCGLAVFNIKEKGVMAQSSSLLGISETVIQQHLARMGRTVGSPWRQDEKFAALVAWLALGADDQDGKSRRKVSAHRKPDETGDKARNHGAKSC